MPPRKDASFDRVRHFQGQRLRAGDLQDQYDSVGDLRGLHVIGLHDTWGIAIGLEAFAGPAGTFYIGSGMAYDAYGRELVLSSVSAVANPYASQPDAEEGVWELRLRLREGAEDCSDGRDASGPELVWRREGAPKLGVEVPLMSANIGDGNLDGPHLEVRRYAGRQAKPRIATGLTPPAQLWAFWTEQSNDTLYSLGIQTYVDTSAGGFVSVPRYIASLQGDPLTLLSSSSPEAWKLRLSSHVDQASPGGFYFRVLLSRAPQLEGLTAELGEPGPEEGPAAEDIEGASEPLNEATEPSEPAQPLANANAARATMFAFTPFFFYFPIPLRVAWTGVEPLSDCRPEIHINATAPTLSHLVASRGARAREVFGPSFQEEAKP